MKKLFKSKVFTALVVLLLLLAIAYGAVTGYYYSHYMHNTKILGIDVSEKNVTYVSDKLQERLDDSSVNITFADGKTEKLDGTEMELTLNQLETEKELRKVLSKQRAYLWPKYFFEEESYEVNILSDDSIKEIDYAVKHLEHNTDKYEKPAEDAKVIYDKEKNKFSIEKEKLGTVIDDEKLFTIVESAFLTETKAVALKDNEGYVPPQIYSTDEKLNKLMNAANEHCAVNLTYQTIDGDYTIDGSEVINWLTYDEEKQDYIKDDKVFKKNVTEFVKGKLEPSMDTVGRKRTFKSGNGKMKTVGGGNFGSTLHSKDEIKALLKAIEEKKTGIAKPNVTGYQKSTENGGLGDTFVEVDMSAQKLYYHYKGKVVLTSNVVTGLYSNPERRTPGGVYYVYFKQRDRVLTGSKNEYHTLVHYWMAFNMGIGLHDAYWRGSFGGNVFRTNGSHGCVNLPSSVAKALYYGNGSYEGVHEGTPVVCYY